MIAALLVAFGLFLPASSWTQQVEPVSATEQFHALVESMRSEGGDFRGAKTDADRRAVVEHMHVAGTRYAQFARAHASDPIVLEAVLEAIRALNGEDSLIQISWELNTADFPEPGAGNPADGLVALLLRDHLRSEKLVEICLRMSYGMRPEYETFLDRIVQENPSEEVRGVACLALAQYRNARLLKLDIVRERPELAPRFERLLGKESFDALWARERTQAGAEVEALFTKAAESFGSVKHPYGGTIGDKARSELFEIRNLAIGKTPPDIQGLDQDGQPLKLSDFRGRVVLLDFWSEF